ncbi:alpha/beta hydrolase [Halalkalibacter akibai]|uniref:Alpha/beta hydrolase n=1 Tax=Halalkalibacter akibai (strain ATCC 43226 / DSM 21942 / CIP 109018 / JCM 9157 / 1139) TaxID=1236973 RepID=W4QSZ7_HALA3|nr:alpha/beta hydrolase [Halalkalibacter akibai]GAE34763.1 alpha/beta hydrolase [Halalkalibacter akibai JCM 9157]
MKKIIIILGSVVAILIIAYGLVGNYFYNFALSVDREKEFMEDNPNLAESEAVLASVAEEAELADALWLEQQQPTQLTIQSADKLNLNLNAYVYENESANHKWAIVVHGYTGDAISMKRYARNFHERGYHVLAPDLRGHGESEGNYIGMGWHDRKDLLLWIEQVIEEDPEAEIVLFGISMGGATVMMTSGEEDLPANVKVIVEDCGYSSVSEVFVYQLNDLFGLPPFPVINAANTVTNFRAGYDLYEASAVEQVAKSQTPILFIHGDADTFVPYEMLDEVYNAATVDKDKLIIEGAGHGDAEKVDPVRYWNSVWSFVEKYID